MLHYLCTGAPFGASNNVHYKFTNWYLLLYFRRHFFFNTAVLLKCMRNGKAIFHLSVYQALELLPKKMIRMKKQGWLRLNTVCFVIQGLQFSRQISISNYSLFVCSTHSASSFEAPTDSTKQLLYDLVTTGKVTSSKSSFVLSKHLVTRGICRDV